MENELEKQIAEAEKQDSQQRLVQDDVAFSLGALEAVGDYFTAGDPYVLPERQKRLVELVRQHNKHQQSHVAAAIDNNIATESFTEFVNKVGKKALISTMESLPKSLEMTSQSLAKYAGIAEQVLKRLRQLRPILEKRGDQRPANEEFDMGSHRRFLQTNNVEIADYGDFVETFNRQAAATNHTYVHGIGFSTFIADRIIKDLDKLQVPSNGDLRDDLRKSIVFHWINVWRDGFSTAVPGSVPKDFIGLNPDCRCHAVCALFDARYLVATEPRKAKDLSLTGKYRAALAFDRKSEVKPDGKLALPYASEFIALLDKAISVMNDMQYYAELAKKCDRLARDFKKSSKTVIESLDKKIDENSLKMTVEYIQLVATCSQLITSPHVDMAWMTVRSCLVVAAMAESIVTTAERDMVINNKFFASQGKGFSAGLESFLDVSAALAAVAAIVPPKTQ